MSNNPVHLPPQSLEAEMAVLGSMMIEPDAVEKAVDALDEKDFYQDAHRKIFRVVREIFARSGRGIDVVTTQEELRRQKLLEDVGGPAYLAELISKVATAAHVDYYSKIVREKAILREMITAATGIVSNCYGEVKEPALLLDEAQAAIMKVAERQSLHGVVEAKDLAHEVIEMIEQAANNKKSVTGIPSGLKEIDRMTSGFQKSDLILIGARPSQGKTALALNIAANVVLSSEEPKSVLFFSLEMSRHAIMQRFISSEARVSLQLVRNGFFPRHKWTELTNAAARLSESPLAIVDSSNLSVLTLRSIARQYAADRRRKGKKLDLIMIDYLQLMRGSGNRQENRQQEVSEISRGLKFLARDLDCPVIALSQLSRRTEDKGRTDQKPMLSDLRESGALEQDADLIMFIYREAYYKRNDPTLENKAEIIIAKQRQGPTGDVALHFNREFTRFENALPEGQAGGEEPPVEYQESQTSFG